MSRSIHTLWHCCHAIEEGLWQKRGEVQLLRGDRSFRLGSSTVGSLLFFLLLPLLCSNGEKLLGLFIDIDKLSFEALGVERMVDDIDLGNGIAMGFVVEEVAGGKLGFGVCGKELPLFEAIVILGDSL